MRYPEFLAPGGTIGFAAPSFGIADEVRRSAFQNSLEVFHALGYRTFLGPNVYEDRGIGISNTPERCAAELTDLYSGSCCDALLSVGGGELMCEILPFLDFDRLREARPKWYMGYSDNTNFTFLLPTLCDTAAFYAPCAGSFGMEPWHSSIRDAFSFLTGRSLSVRSYDGWEKESLKGPDAPLLPYHITEPFEMKAHGLQGAPFSGRFLGGCLDILTNFPGTPYDRVKEFCERYREDGIIWYLEACDLTVFDIRRALWHLREAGWFRYVRGFLFGRPLCMGEQLLGLSQYEAVLDPLKDFSVPILMDLDIGHLPPMMPLISGGYGTVSPTETGVSIDFSLKP